MIVDDLLVSPTDFHQRTGWEAKPEGLCKGDVCVPAPDAVVGDRLDIRILADKLGMPLVSDPSSGVHAVGPEAMGHSLTTAVAPELELPDADGNVFRLSSLHGRKVLLVAWASW